MRLRTCHEHAVFGSRLYRGPSTFQDTHSRLRGYAHLQRYMQYLDRNQHPTADDYGISMREAFALAAKQVPSIVVRPGLVGGNPCIKGTRIPVYMVLDGIEYHGNLKGVLKSYPQLSVDQVKDAVRFAKIALECYVEP